MTRIAFYAPLKPPDHPVASGDRAMARALIAALTLAGHKVCIASRFRSYVGGDGERQARLKTVGERLADRLLRRSTRVPSPFAGEGQGGGKATAPAHPELWFTYHLYHKAPDWLGPAVSASLGIPYVLAEASYAPKQAGGRWDIGHRAVADAIRRADRIFQLNPADAECVAPLLASPERLVSLPPFLDAAPFRAPDRLASRAAMAARFDLDPHEPWLLTVAMMRSDQKLLSYRALASALTELTDLSWRLILAGVGPAEENIRKTFTPFGDRIRWVGALDAGTLRQVYRAADIYVWPAIKEAWGMAFLEAQAAGLPVVAGRSGGVPAIVADGETGLLSPEGDTGAFAASLRAMLTRPDLRDRMGQAAMESVARKHDIAVASNLLDRHIRMLTPGKMIQLLVIRHAATDWNEAGRIQGHADRSLSESGRSWASNVALPDGWADAQCLSSPLVRAMETARLIGLQPRPEPLLVEMDWGAWEGRRLADLRAELGVAMAENEARGLDFRPPGGESPRDVQERLRRFLAGLSASAVAVTHRGVLRALYAMATGWTMREKPAEGFLPGCAHLFAIAADGGVAIERLSMPLEPRR